MFYSHCSPQKATRFASDFLQNFFAEENLNKYFSGTMPATNISETENSFVIELAVPGLQKEDFEIAIEQNLLSVKVDKTPAQEAENTPHFKRREFDFTNFKRTFRLGKGVEADRIAAQYEQGILRLELPKKDQAQEKTTRTVNVL
jgi:HSP20 family protein